MQFLLADDYETLSQRAEEAIVAEIRQRPDLVLVAATGASPARTYELLASRHSREPALFERLRLVKLDEWAGLPMTDPATCEVYLMRTLVHPLRLSEDRYLAFQSDALDPEAECARIRDRFRQLGPIDLCVLGLGINGHLGLNEPDEFLHPFAHVAHLSDASRRHPMLAQTKLPVTSGMTLGLAEILAARRIFLLVNGAHKREAMIRLRSGEISTRFPASLLWVHPDVTCFFDLALASGLEQQAESLIEL